jgi:hypothetical protein
MQINKTILALLIIVFVAAGCASASKPYGKNCGCASKKGMSGY